MSRMSSMPAGSRPFIGSSRISSCGSPRRQAATPRRWRMPMEYFDTLSSARCRMPTRSSAGSMRPLAAGSRAAARICRFWRPVRWPWKRGSSTMAPTRARATVTVAGDGVAEEGHRAGIGVGQAQQHPDQRGLAGTVRPEVAEGAAAGNEELDVVDGDVLAESLGQPVGLDGPPDLDLLLVRESPWRSSCCPAPRLVVHTRYTSRSRARRAMVPSPGRRVVLPPARPSATCPRRRGQADGKEGGPTPARRP